MKVKIELDLILFCHSEHPEGFGDDEDNPYVAGMDRNGHWYWVNKKAPYLEHITSESGLKTCAASIAKKEWVEIDKFPWEK